jgi:hypothetical protein
MVCPNRSKKLLGGHQDTPNPCDVLLLCRAQWKYLQQLEAQGKLQVVQRAVTEKPGDFVAIRVGLRFRTPHTTSCLYLTAKNSYF